MYPQKLLPTIALLSCWLIAAMLGCTQRAFVNPRGSLNNLQGVHVITKIDGKTGVDDLFIEKLQTKVELRLRAAGIRVLTKEEVMHVPGNPYLYITVHFYRIGDLQLYACAIKMELIQKVILTRKPITETTASTWSRLYVGGVGEERFEDVPETVASDLDTFINDYLAANPK